MARTCPRCGKATDLIAPCAFCGYAFKVEAAVEAASNAEKRQAIDERITASKPNAHRTTTAIKVVQDGRPEKPEPCDEPLCRRNPSPYAMLAYGMGVIGIMALAGYVCGLAQGQGMEFVLAVCCGALGGFVVFLGYGPVAFIIGFLGDFTDWIQGKKKR
jgi:hypothetical protein